MVITIHIMLFIILMLITNVYANCINVDNEELGTEMRLKYEYDSTFKYGKMNTKLVKDLLLIREKDCSNIEIYYNNTLIAYSEIIVHPRPFNFFDNNYINKEIIMHNCDKYSNFTIKLGWDSYDNYNKYINYNVIYFNDERIYIDYTISSNSYSLYDSNDANQSIISSHYFNEDRYDLSIMSDKYSKIWVFFFVGNFDLVGNDDRCVYTNGYYFTIAGIVIFIVFSIMCFYDKLKGNKLKNFYNKNTFIYSESNSVPGTDNYYDSCIICFENYKNNDVIKILSCSDFHHYHKKCILEWFKRKKKCPLCLQEFTI